jgi:hypothetical protein
MARNKKKRTILMEGDIDAADTVTFKNVTVTSKGGITQTKRIRVDLYPHVREATPPAVEPEGPFANDIEMLDSMPDAVLVSEPRHRKVRGCRRLPKYTN